MSLPEDRISKAYQALFAPQKNVIINGVREFDPRTGEHILDFGCGTGELSAYMAALVGPTGHVLGVDPDPNRIQVAIATHKESASGNLDFALGSSFGLPGEGEQTFDAVFSNAVLHLVSNKEDLFNKLYGSLKKGGRIHFVYLRKEIEAIRDLLTHFGREDQLKELGKIRQFHDLDAVESYVCKAGFTEVKLREHERRWTYDSTKVYCEYLKAATNGVCDLSSISKERLGDYKPCVGENGKLTQVVQVCTLTARVRE